MFRLAYVLLLLLLISYQIQVVVQATNNPIVYSRDEATMDSRPTRSLFSIVWGCISTTIICAWAALHPNIPPHEGPFKGALRRLELMLWTIVAPEILPCWALNQLLAAMTVRDEYNRAKGYEPERCDIWKTLKEFFSLYEIDGAVNPVWTLKHGHFLIMGGIHIVEPVDKDVNSASGGAEMEEQAATSLVGADTEQGRTSSEKLPGPEEGRVTILTLEMLRELVKDKEFDIRLSETEITHRSKGDGLSKAIFILQSSWFIIQCIARRVQGLDLTQLELTTLALASLNGITFILWWHKPLGAQAVVRVYMKRKLTNKERNVEERGHSYRSRIIANIQRMFNRRLTLIRLIVLRQSEGNAFVDWLILLPSNILILLVFPVVAFGIAFFDTIIDLVDGSTSFPADASHVPTFYVPKHKYSGAYHSSLLLALGTLFGGIHCAGWNLQFPTSAEQKLWRVASLAVTIIPLSVMPFAGLVWVVVKSFFVIFRSGSFEAAKSVSIGSVFLISVVAYVCARFVLLGQALELLRHLPPNALFAVQWSQFYPHFL